MARQRGRGSSPYKIYGTSIAVVTGGATVALYFTGLPLLAAWLAAINLVTFGAYGIDKAMAVRGRLRIPEVILHGAALVGGTPAAYAGQQLFRHKRKKGAFLFVFWLTVMLQVVGLIAWWRL